MTPQTYGMVREKLVNCDVHLDIDQIDTIIGIIDDLGYSDMYRAKETVLAGIERDCYDSRVMFSFHKDSPLADTLRQAKAKAEGKGS